MRKVIVALVFLTTPLFGEKHPASCQNRTRLPWRCAEVRRRRDPGAPRTAEPRAAEVDFPTSRRPSVGNQTRDDYPCHASSGHLKYLAGMSSVEAGEGHEQVFDGADGVSTSDSFDVRRLGRLVDQIYVLCEKKCSDSTLARLIPAESLPRVTLLNGAAHDECLEIRNKTHNIKATASHKGAVRDALMRGYSRVMVLEEDSEWLKPQDPWTELEWINFGLLIYSDMWDIIRLGYTACQTNDATKDNQTKASCNDQCLCPFHNGTRWCTTKHVHCDLRDSHAYLLNRKAMDRFIKHGGGIDMEIFRQFRHTLLIPPVAEQPANWEKTRAKKAAAPRRRLGSSKERVHALYRVFEKSCVLPM